MKDIIFVEQKAKNMNRIENKAPFYVGQSGVMLEGAPETITTFMKEYTYPLLTKDTPYRFEVKVPNGMPIIFNFLGASDIFRDASVLLGLYAGCQISLINLNTDKCVNVIKL